jgi:hypothetical protein
MVAVARKPARSISSRNAKPVAKKPVAPKKGTTRTPPVLSRAGSGNKTSAPVKAGRATTKTTTAARKTRTAAPAAVTVTKTSARKVAEPVTAPERKTRTVTKDPITGFTPGSDSHVIATELMKGGDNRTDVIQRLRGILSAQARSGNPKNVANQVAATWRKMQEMGFTTEESYRAIPPTGATVAKVKETPAETKPAVKRLSSSSAKKPIIKKTAPSVKRVARRTK